MQQTEFFSNKKKVWHGFGILALTNNNKIKNMSYSESNNPQAANPTDNRKLIYGILITALIATWGYIFYDKSQTKESLALLQTKITNVDSARNTIQQEFILVSAKADSLTQTN